MAVTSGISGAHGGRSADVTQTATITRVVAQVSDLGGTGGTPPAPQGGPMISLIT